MIQIQIQESAGENEYIERVVFFNKSNKPHKYTTFKQDRNSTIKHFNESTWLELKQQNIEDIETVKRLSLERLHDIIQTFIY